MKSQSVVMRKQERSSFNVAFNRWSLLALCACALVGTAFVFSAGIGTGYLFDDYSSVYPLRELREHPKYFWELVTADSSGPLGRPVSMITFALEQAWLHAEPAFSQRVSIAIHLLNSVLVFALLYSLLENAADRQRFALALFAAVLWACTPQKMSSVLYIVQRMALLSAFFTLVALMSYWTARRAPPGAGRVALYALTLLAVLLAPFAKENGVLAVPMLAALEVLAVPRTAPGSRYLRLLATAVLGVGLLGFVVLGFVEYLRADVTYAGRNFSFFERLSTTPPILLDYIRQYFVPQIGRLGLLHDDYRIITATSDPLRFWLPLTALLLALAYVLRICLHGRRSLLALGVALFLIGHSLESTFLPLELYFEHRNYLPSVGLALFFGAAWNAALARIGQRRYALILAGVYLGAMMLSSLATSSRWSSYESLLVHHLTGHPRSSRANADYGLLIAGARDYDAASSYIQRGYELSLSEPAAKTISLADVALLRIAAACLAKRPFADVLPDVATVVTPQGVHGISLRVLRRMHQDGACPETDWSAVSDWLEAFVAKSREGGYDLGYLALRDLVNLERSFGSPVRSFVYAAMAVEQHPRSGSMVLTMLDAALALEDGESAAIALERARVLRREQALSARERRLLESLEARAEQQGN